MEIVALVVGIVLGLVIGWLVRAARGGKEQANQQAEMARLKGQLEQTATAQQLLEQAKAQFSAAAELTAAEALKGNSEQFLKLANENLGKTMEQAKGEFEQRHRQFQELVKPLSENYGKLNPQIETLAQQSQSLATATGKLSSALTDVRQVGHWGEVQLRKVVEMANMTAYSDFAEQATFEAGQERPDLIVRLPEGRTVVIDAKASIAAALEAQEAADETTANAAWERHAGNLKAQVTNLSRKKYGGTVPGSLDFVVMFVPGDQFLAAALKSDPGLVDYAMSQRIALATPATLIAMLWAVNSGWQQYRLTEDAARIKQVGDEMYKRLLTFINHYARVGKGLETVLNSYNQSVGSFDRNVVPQGRRFAELVVGNETEFNPPPPIDELPRQSNYAAAETAEEEGEPQLAAADN